MPTPAMPPRVNSGYEAALLAHAAALAAGIPVEVWPMAVPLAEAEAGRGRVTLVGARGSGHPLLAAMEAAGLPAERGADPILSDEPLASAVTVEVPLDLGRRAVATPPVLAERFGAIWVSRDEDARLAMMARLGEITAWQPCEGLRAALVGEGVCFLDFSDPRPYQDLIGALEDIIDALPDRVHDRCTWPWRHHGLRGWEAMRALLQRCTAPVLAWEPPPGLEEATRRVVREAGDQPEIAVKITSDAVVVVEQGQRPVCAAQGPLAVSLALAALLPEGMPASRSY